MKTVPVKGRVVGHHIWPETKEVRAEVVHVAQELCPHGPAENAFLYIEIRKEGNRWGRYMAWINLYDVEHAAKKDEGAWLLVEPQTKFDHEIHWRPYGWGGPPLPSVADSRIPGN